VRRLDDLPPQVTVYEVGPRDGLQNEKQTVSTEDKVRFVDLLSAAGLPAIEVTSFVQPGAISQLADAEAVLDQIERHEGVCYTALVPNMRGMERALGSRLGGIALFTAASETFSLKNTNATIAETLERFRPVLSEARRIGTWVRAYISTSFGCPYEGEVPPQAVVKVARDLANLGARQIVISDTIGVATPTQVVSVVEAVTDEIETARLALHFHDTRGTALSNVLAGLQLGVTVYDSSAGGLGGCPYAPGAAGNLATEDLVYMLNGMGLNTGVDLGRVVEASTYLMRVTGRPPPSRYFQAATS
jgi:isopropylmalate/homocitrate/citramalate synthase